MCIVGKGKVKNACAVCGKFGHRAAECWSRDDAKSKGKGWQKGRGNETERSVRTCFGCGSTSHVIRDCPWKNQKGKGEGKQNNQGTGTGTMVKACFGCGSASHIFGDCPDKSSKQVYGVGADEESELLFVGHVITKDGKNVKDGDDGNHNDEGAEALELVMKQARKTQEKPWWKVYGGAEDGNSKKKDVMRPSVVNLKGTRKIIEEKSPVVVQKASLRISISSKILGLFPGGPGMREGSFGCKTVVCVHARIHRSKRNVDW